MKVLRKPLRKTKNENTLKKTKEYKEWWDKVKKDHPEWTSWDYGLSISWDNNPGKDKTGESAPETPTDLVGSESTPEDPKRQETLALLWMLNHHLGVGIK